MKTKLYILIAVFFMSIGVNAQIDRSQQPKPGPAPEISLEEPQEFELKNGLKIMVVENHKLPRVSFRLAFDRDPVVEGSKAGVTSLLGAMLGNGTTNISKDEFTKPQSLSIKVNCPSRNKTYRSTFPPDIDF